MEMDVEKIKFCDGLDQNEKLDYCEGHLGVILGLLTVLFDNTVCPDLVAESDENLVGKYYRVRDNGTYEFESGNFSTTKMLFYNFDPLKLTCKKMLQQIQFMTKLVSQLKFLMDLADINVRIFNRII